MSTTVDCPAEIPTNIVNINTRALVRAIKKNNIEHVRRFLSKKENVYKQESNSFTPLHHAAERGNVEIVKLLFEHGYGTVNALNKQNKTPFQLALRNNYEDVIKYLFQNGAKSALSPLEFEELINIYVETEKVEMLKYFIQGETVSDFTIYCAVKGNYLESLKCLIEFGGNTNKTSSFNILHKAAENGNLEMVKFLFNNGYDVIGAEDNEGKIPLYFAVTKDHEDVVEFLMDNGARDKLTFEKFNELIRQSIVSPCLYVLNTLNSNETILDTVFNIAVSNGHLEIIEFLMECGVKIIWNSSSETPLQCAARCGHLDIVKYLLENEHVANEAKSFNGCSPSRLAVSKGHLEIVKYFYKLQKEGKEDHMKKSDSPSSLLYMAAYYSHLDVMKYLIECGANFNWKEEGDETVLHYAICWRQVEAVRLLLEHGANETSVSGHITAERVGDEILTILFEAGHSMKSYFEGKKPILVASELGFSKFVKALTSSGVEKEDYKIALNLAAIRRNVEVVNILLKAAANSNDTTIIGLKTLEYVICNHYRHRDYKAQVEILKNLLAHTPKRDLEYFVLTGIKWAVGEQTSITIIKLLLEHDFNNNFKLAIHYIEKRIQVFNVLIHHIERLETLFEFESLILHQKFIPFIKKNIEHALISRIIFLKSISRNCEDAEAHLNFVKFFKLEEWCQKCQKEIDHMKKTKISSSDVTYHDFFAKSDHKIVDYIRNEKLFRNLCFTEFELYRDYFEKKIESARSRILVIDESKKCLYNVIRQSLQIQLSNEIVDKICEYLCVIELERLQQAFPSLSS